MRQHDKCGFGVCRISKDELAAARMFYGEVCKLAEDNMLKTGKVEGAHYAAMKTVLAEWKESAEAYW